MLQSGRKYVDSTLSALTADIASQQQQQQLQLQAASLTGAQSNTSNNGNEPQPQPQSATELQQSTERVAELEREIAALQQYNAQWAQSYTALEAQYRLLVCASTQFYCTRT